MLKLSSYVPQLEATGGVISEFVNPKYKDASKTAFKSSTRLECMMQVRREVAKRCLRERPTWLLRAHQCTLGWMSGARLPDKYGRGHASGCTSFNCVPKGLVKS